MSRPSAAADPRGQAVPPVVAPPPGNPRFPLFDSLRAIAALSVLLFHTALLAGVRGAPGKVLGQLNVGVTIFFLISGFLLYRPYAAARAGRAPAPSPGQYAWRRALRILPAYWLALFALAVWPGLAVADGDWWVLGTLQQTNPLAHDPAPCLAAGGCGLPQTWSLSAELGFYVLLPFLAPVLGRLRRPLAALALLAAGSMAFLAVAVRSYPEHPRLFVMHLGLAGTFLWFALGMSLAWLSVAFEGREQASRALRLVERRPELCWLGALICLAALTALPVGAVESGPEVARHLLRHALLGLLAALLLLPAIFGQAGGGWPRRTLASRALAWLGLVSYGVFLWHYTLAAELRERLDVGFPALTALTLAAAVAAAAVSYYALERPVLRLKRVQPRLPRWLPRWALVVFAVALAVRIALIVATPGFEPVLDPSDYHRHAVSIASGDGYPHTVIAADKHGPTAFRPPLYPYLLGSVYAVSGNSWTAGRLLGALLGALAAVLAALLARELWGRRAGMAAGGLVAMSPPLVALNASLSAEALFVPLELAALLTIWLCLRAGGALRWALAAGALCGLAVLTRGNGLVLLAPLVIGLLFAPVAPRRRVALTAAALGAVALILAPWGVRNSVEFHAFVPLGTQTGITASGTYGPLPMNDARGKGSWRPPFPDPLYRDLFRRADLDEVQLERVARHRAIEFVGDHPAYALEVLALNGARLLHPAGSTWLANDSYDELGVPGWLRPLVTGGYYAVALLALLALALAARGSATARLGPLWLWIAAPLMLLSAAAFSGAPRYRAPLDPFLTLLAGLALATVIERARERGRLRQPTAEQRAEHAQSV